MSRSVRTVALTTCCYFALITAPYAQSAEPKQALDVAQSSGTAEPDQEGDESQDSSSAPAQAPNMLTMPPVTVTADRKQKTLMETPANVSTVTREDLDRRMDNVIEEVFKYEPGIEVPKQTTGTDPFSSSGGIRIRGVGGNRTQVLVDGNRTIERITDSTRDIVESSNVKAVEIIRGPGSVLWGSDALGGTVNFVTKDPSDYLTGGKTVGGSADFSYGTVDEAFTESVTGAARFSRKFEALLSYTRRDGRETDLDNARIGPYAIQDCPRNPEATPCNEFDPTISQSNNLLSKLVWHPSDTNQFRLTGEYFNRDTSVDQNSVLGSDGTSDIHLYHHDQEIERYRLSLDQDWLVQQQDWLDRVKWQVTYSPQKVNRFNERYRTVIASGDEERRDISQYYEETFYEGDFQLESSFNWGDSLHTLTYGIDGDYTTTDYQREDITYNYTTDTTTVARAGGFNFADASTTRLDGYLQDEISLYDGRLKITPGVRYTNYSINPKTDSDYQLVPGAEPKKVTASDLQFKLGTIYELTDTYSIYGQFAQGFKMPTAQQLYQSLDSLPAFALVPNPNLEPESVDSYELGFRGDYGNKGYFSINGFVAKYKNFIENFVDADPTQYGLPPGTMTLTYDNADSLLMYGIEATAAMQLSDNFSTRVALSYQKGEIEDGGVERVYNGALPLQLVTGLRYVHPSTGIDIELVGTFQDGSAEVDDPATEFSPAGYAVFDILAGWQASENLTFRAGLTNIFDTRYFGPETRGFPINGSDAVKRTNPIELQTAPGRSLKVGLSYKF
ncbi:TonB-dependent hemoglobin/transferrin/lactoferrin family receptor [uncultured Sneathiella sp.]|uniref:TonB-dependent hemoglobin/transferrin/lactoferrin family receptor n=1 Tax=uncultured Sneathiella sp. TaxID=879315 RepID=UPI0030EDB860|tara:strand:- start:39172 stop:41532 length:2361 start_codon:yes stop_codon:yes gene_type:complete